VNLKFIVFEAGTKWQYAVRVSLENGKSIPSAQMLKWCTNSFGKGAYSSDGYAVFYFLTEQQRTWFLLRWS
jgi:hypothetical protein